MSIRMVNDNWFKRHKIWTGVIAFVILIFLIGALSGDEETKEDEHSPLGIIENKLYDDFKDVGGERTFEQIDDITWKVSIGNAIWKVYSTGYTCSDNGYAQTYSGLEYCKDIFLNLCLIDEENADYWTTTKVNLFDKPGGIQAGAKIVAELEACSSLRLEIIDKQTVDGLEYYRVKYQDKEGWQTKRLLVGD